MVSSMEDNVVRDFLLYILRTSYSKPVDYDQLMSWQGKPESQLKQLISRMLELNWLKQVDGRDHHYDQYSDRRLNQVLGELSSEGEALLADDRGLLIMQSGLTLERASHLAASSARLLSVNELSRQRNMDLYNGQPWGISMHWGGFQSRVQYLCLGSVRFVLLIVGQRKFESPAFPELLALLAGRYLHE